MPCPSGKYIFVLVLVALALSPFKNEKERCLLTFILIIVEQKRSLEMIELSSLLLGLKGTGPERVNGLSRSYHWLSRDKSPGF